MSEYYHSYVLRLWRSHAQAPWRLSLQNTLSGATETFIGPAALLFYLLAVMEKIDESDVLHFLPKEEDASLPSQPPEGGADDLMR